MLYTKFVELTAGLVKPRTLIWNGSRMNAPDTPAREVKADTTSATSGGRNTQVFTPDTGKNIENISMASEYSTKKLTKKAIISSWYSLISRIVLKIPFTKIGAKPKEGS